jgi:iron-sulfur cluster repair protein YtfE (RIC family)
MPSSNSNNHAIETRADAWARRAALAGDVDFTMMYIAHDAFNRDLANLVDAAESGRERTPQAAGTWSVFNRQLHTHHTAEDTALWPRLRAVATEPAEQAILDAMEAEHASLDPTLTQIDKAMADHDHEAATGGLNRLAAALSAHMVHEETEALPLLERRLGNDGWEAFTKEIRDQVGGVKGAAEYLPWVLDGATQETKATVLGTLPAPARLIYRTSWEPKYRKAVRL